MEITSTVEVEVYIHLSQLHLNSVFHNSWHLIVVTIPCLRSVHFKNVKCQDNSRELFLSTFISFITFPVGQKCTYTQLVFGSIAFKLCNLDQTFRIAFHELPTISWVNFGPSSWQTWSNWVRFVGLLAHARFFRSAYKCSIGLRSGLCDGHSNTLTLCP
jgi:hypothetical protein